MAADSQHDVDRATIEAFEALWQRTVIEGTQQSVRNTVAEAIAELVQAARLARTDNQTYRAAIDDHLQSSRNEIDADLRSSRAAIDADLRKLSALSDQVSAVIKSGARAAEAASRFGDRAPEIGAKIAQLESQLARITKELEKEDGWQKRLDKWRRDRRLRAMLLDLQRTPAQSVAINPADDDRDDPEPSLPEAAPIILPSPKLSRRSFLARLRPSWWLVAIALGIGALGGYAIHLYLDRGQVASHASPASIRTHGGDEAELSDATAEWKRLREADVARGWLANFCSSPEPCTTDQVLWNDSPELVWAGLSVESQRDLFRLLVDLEGGHGELASAQCPALVARPELDRIALEFAPQVARCVVQQDFDRDGQPIAGEELKAIALRLLAYGHRTRAGEMHAAEETLSTGAAAVR